MAKTPQLETQIVSKDTAQFNIEIPKATKKNFFSFCLENDLTLKDAGERALLEFMDKHEK